MWETDLVQARSERARLPWSYISSLMGFGTGDRCHVPFVVRNKCFCCWCGKSFSSFVTFALGWALASQCSVTIQFGLGTGDPCYWLASHFSRMVVGSFPASSSNPAALSVFIRQSWWKRLIDIGEHLVLKKRELDVLWKPPLPLSLCFFFLSCILTTCQKVLNNVLFPSSSKQSWTREEDGERGRGKESVSERSLAAEQPWNTAL